MSRSEPGKAPVIFLVGMPGCGKSTVGKALAQHLNLTFLDLDTLIEEQENATVPQLFETKGQAYFREAEARALRHVTQQTGGVVLATGGGAPCFHDNMDFMVASGRAVYLQLAPSALQARLTRQDLEARPLLRDKSPAALLAYLTQTLAEREAFYQQASFLVEVGNQTIAQVVKAIERQLGMPH